MKKSWMAGLVLAGLMISVFAIAADENLVVRGYGSAEASGSELIARDRATSEANLDAFAQCSDQGQLLGNITYPWVSCYSITLGSQTTYRCSAWVDATCYPTKN